MMDRQSGHVLYVMLRGIHGHVCKYDVHVKQLHGTPFVLVAV